MVLEKLFLRARVTVRFGPWLQMQSIISVYLRILTCAAITRCLSAMSVHLAHRQSFHLQNRLWPLSADTTPWLRHRAHLGVRWKRSGLVEDEEEGERPNIL